MIFRAGSLIANMVMGIILLNKTYTPLKYLSVGLVSAGISLCTIMSASSKPTSTSSEEDSSHQIWLFVGIGILTFALFMSARMGIYQEVLYGEYGKHPKEALFYSHAPPLPHHVSICFNSSTISIFSFNIPSMLLYLLGNVITQYICISNVFVLTSECASLTVTL